MIKKFILFFILVFIVSILTGCSRESITIKHNTPTNSYESIIKEGQKPKSIVKKSSGIIIYKDVSSTTEVNNTGKINFGPKDVNFDLPVNIR